MFQIKQAVIVAGGKGTRLGKLTSRTPKPLIKLEGKPFLEYLIEFLQRNSIKEIIILAGFKGKKFSKMSKKYKNVRVFIEKKPLGTGGALINHINKLDRKFIFLNGDSFFDLNLQKEIILNYTNNYNIFFLVKNNNYKSNKKLSSLKINKEQLLEYSDKKNNLMYSGISILNRKDLLSFNKNKKISFENEIVDKLIKRKKVIARILKKFFIDIGTKKNLNYAKKNFMNKTKKKCFFFDRDNTLIYDEGYTHKKKDLKWKFGIINIIKQLNELDYLVIVVTNQSGVARGYYNEKKVKLFHEYMNNELKKENAFIDDFYYCPFHKSGIGKYKKNSIDRKPNNGMLIKAIKKWNINIKKSYMVGDNKSDYLAAKKTNIKFIMADNQLLKKIKNEIKNND